MQMTLDINPNRMITDRGANKLVVLIDPFSNCCGYFINKMNMH